MASGIRRPLKLDGKLYEVSPLDDNARDSLDEWVRSRYIEQAANLVSKLPDSDKDRALKVAYAEATSLSWMSGIGAKLITTVDGVARIAWEGIRKNHPEITYEFVRQHIITPETIREANRAFEDLNNKGTGVNPKGGDPKKSLAQRKRQLSRKKKST